MAEKLGKTVSELLREIPSSELTEWMAYLNMSRQQEPQEPDAKSELSRRFGARVKKKGR